MNLSDAQKEQVRAWISQGLKISDIQTKLAKDCGVAMTYLEVRFLVDDLKLVPKDPEPPKAPPAPPAPAAAPTAPGAPAPELAEELPQTAPGGGQVSVTVDELAVPGTMVSGKVTFSDGQTAQWYMDEMGRLGIAAKQKGYRPPQTDIQAFQLALQKELSKLGM